MQFDRHQRLCRDQGFVRRSPGITVLVTLAALTGVGVVALTPAVTAASGFACASSDLAGYAVSEGDSWFGIAARAGVSAAALLDANAASEGDAIHPGDVLCLPGGADAGAACSSRSGSSYTVRDGDGWFGIAEAAGVSAGALLGANGASADRTLHPGEVICLPAGAGAPAAASAPTASSGAPYTVVAGDSWFTIAARAGVSTRALLAANGADADRVLLPGIVVTLPSGATALSSASSGASSSSGSSGASGGYTVAAGDSWFSIAERAGVTARALLKVNDASADEVLLPGETIALPSGADAAAARRTARSNGVVTLGALPVQGPCGYADTWHDPRSGGRRHVGVDIFTKRNGYVYAVVDGKLTGRDWDQPWRISGNAWTLTSGDGSGTYFYYAHLAAFAPGLKVGSTVKAGQIIGFVGDTGNAAAVHLHFEVHPNGGGAVNPYNVVRAAGGCNNSTPYTQPGGWVPD